MEQNIKSNIAAISCARMASTRFYGKCLANLNGQSLIQYTIDFANKLHIPLYIWTRDFDIMEYVKDKCPIIYEPLSLYDTNKNTTYDKMKFANQILGCDYLILLQPTQPIREKTKIINWINWFIDHPQAGYGYSTLSKLNYNANGLFYIYRKSFLTRCTGDTVIFKDKECFDIDTREDLKECEAWLQKQK